MHRPSKYQKDLARQLSDEYKVRIVLADRKDVLLDRRGLYVCETSTVYIADDLSNAEFHHVIFHEIRHAIQDRYNLYLVNIGKVHTVDDATRYLYDRFRAEIDADSFGITECAIRNLKINISNYYANVRKKELKKMLNEIAAVLASRGFSMSAPTAKGLPQFLRVLGYTRAA